MPAPLHPAGIRRDPACVLARAHARPQPRRATSRLQTDAQGIVLARADVSTETTYLPEHAESSGCAVQRSTTDPAVDSLTAVVAPG